MDGIPDTDAVITTRGLIKLIKYIGIDFANLPEDEFDNPMGESTGAGAIFGATGGVMEGWKNKACDWRVLSVGVRCCDVNMLYR